MSEATASRRPPTVILGRDTAAASLLFYAGEFERGETKRWDLASHLLSDAAAEIERLRGLVRHYADQSGVGPDELRRVQNV